MRIVHLVIGERLAGGETVALQLARGAAARGDDVAFVAPREGAFAELARGEGFAVHLADVSRTFRLGGLLRLARLLRRTGTDVLHTHTQLAPNILGRVAGRLAGVRVVSHLHIENYFRPNRLARAVHRALDNATARLCARIVVVSESTRQALVRQGYPARLMEVVYNGIELPDPPADGAARDALGVPPETPAVAEVARLAEVKGQRVLIEALARIPEARAVLIGEDLEHGGAYRAELERHAARAGVTGRVLFAGYRPDAAELAGAADVVVLPSSIEGLPVVLPEAMARARPVVATPVGGTAELVTDGETGLLVPPGDPDALADAIRGLLADPELRRRMGEAGRRRVAERFSAEAMTRRILEIYDEVAR
jgi:glycosyltransferase involved in cell wall biosynthesis